jgi:hypothetical protein
MTAFPFWGLSDAVLAPTEGVSLAGMGKAKSEFNETLMESLTFI